MGRIILILLVIAAAVLVWKAFGPGTWNKLDGGAGGGQRAIKGPDDDEDFLWELDKKRFKQRRAQERKEKEDEGD